MAKRRFLFLFICFLAAIGAVQAQEPTTTWPYIFNDFQSATIYLKAGGKIEYTANIHLGNSTLHYIDGNDVKESKSKDILLVVFGEQRFMNVNGKLMEVVAEQEGGFIARLKDIDFTRLNETGGAYGASSNTLSTKALTSIEGIGSVTNHAMQVANKESGKELPLRNEYFIVVGGSVYPAEKALLPDFVPVDKKQSLKDFVKKNKIRWSKPADLIKLVDILK